MIGGGAVGLIASRESAKLGLEVEVFEEDSTIGRPESCAGLYSLQGLRRIGIEISDEYLQNVVRGAIIHSPSGCSLEIGRDVPVAAVLSRERLDRSLAEEAMEHGVKINVNSRVSSVEKTGGEIRLRLRNDEIVTASMLIDAEGHEGIIARSLYPSYSAKGWIPVMQMLVTGHGYEPNYVYIWFKNYLRDFFGYLVPIDEKLGKIGIASYRDTSLKAKKFLEEVAPNARIIGYSTSRIYEGLPVEVGLEGNAVLVGNVAGQVKSTTGGGVIVGGICAHYAAQHSYNLLRKNMEGTYRRKVGPIYRELRWIYRIKNWLKSLSDEKIDNLFRHVQETGFDRKVSRIGDMDFQASSILKAFFSLSGIRLVGRVLRYRIF